MVKAKKRFVVQSSTGIKTEPICKQIYICKQKVWQIWIEDLETFTSTCNNTCNNNTYRDMLKNCTR